MILDRILEHKKAELRHKNSRGYLADLKTRIRDAGPTLGFAVTLDARRTAERPALIAEVKKASPSLGLLRPEFEQRFEPVTIAEAYREHGASAVSVLTDKDFFQGDLAYLADVKRTVGLPALNKEFMVADIQFYEARAYGADAVLLIVAGLEKRQLIDFSALAKELSLDVLVETHDAAELDRALRLQSRLIGVNNRNLKDFTVDFARTYELIDRAPDGCTFVAESGLTSHADLAAMASHGVRCFLVGESLMRADDVELATRKLLGNA